MCFLLVISLFKMVVKLSVELLSIVPKLKKAMMCHMENIGVLNEFNSVTRYSAVGQEFSVNEYAIYIK